MSAGLKKSLSMPALIALGAAGAIGSSWVYTASEFFKTYGAGGEIFGMAAGGLLAACIALAYAELASRFPRAGGEIVYAYAAFGRGLAFVAGWALIGAYVSSLAFYVTASGMLLSDLIPAMKTLPIYSVAGTDVYLPVLAFGVALCVGIALVNGLGMEFAGGVQLLLFVVMVATGLVLAAVGFSTGRPENFWPAFATDADPVENTVGFIIPAIAFLTGFSLITTLAEDAKLSPRRMGFTVVATVVVATSFYCVVLLATAWLLPWQQTAAMDDGVISAFKAAGYPALSWAAFAISVLGLITSFLALFSAVSRVVLALARAGLLPAAFARLSDGGRPINALGFTLALSLGLGWLGHGALLWFIDTGGVYIGVAWSISVVCLYRLRKAKPGSQAAFRVRPAWLPAIGAIAAVAVIVAVLVPDTAMSLIWPYEYVILAIWIALGAVIYMVSPRGVDAEARAAVLGDLTEKDGTANTAR